jgi:hypothetical protein
MRCEPARMIVRHSYQSVKFRLAGACQRAIVNSKMWDMKTLIAISCFFFLSGCASLHSPYDLRDWCVMMGSSRLGSTGPGAHDPRNCSKELDEDLADSTPRILYAPRDIVMVPVITARALWEVLARTVPPF